MKKITQIFVAIAIVFSVVLAPVTVNAQVDPIPVDGTSDPAGDGGGLPSTGAPTQAPDTGIEPSSRVAQTLMIFVASSLVGAGLAYGVLQLRKKQQ